MLASVGVREPRELGCASRATAHGQVVDCGYSAVIDHETLLVSLGPHFDCHGERCRLTKDSEITVALGP